MPPSHNGRLREKLVPIAVAAIAVMGVLTVRSCAENQERDWTLSQEDFDEACAKSDVHLGFRGSDTRETFGTLETTEFAGKPVSDLEKRFFPGTPEDVALASIKGANPNLRAKSSSDILPDTKDVSIRVNISNFGKEKLPAGKKLWELSDELGINQDTIACVNRMEKGAHFNKEVAVYVPEQVSTDGGIKAVVVAPGDTYESIAKANGVDVASIAPGSQDSVNQISGHELENGDILYVKNNTVTNKPEIVNPDEEAKKFINKYIGLAKEVEKDFGVPYQVALAQALVETGYGTSVLAVEAHNFHGLQANNEWHGPTKKKDSPELASEADLKKYEGRIVKQTKRPDGLYDLMVTTEFKAFDSDEAGFRGYGDYLKNRMGGKAYADAFETKDPDEFLRRLFNDEGPKYATDNLYLEKTKKFLKIIEASEAPTAQEQTREGEKDLHKIFDSYSAKDRTTKAGDNCKVGPGNKDEISLTPYDRFAIAYNNIEAAKPSKEGYEQFKSSIIDQRNAAKGVNVNFDGSKVPGLGVPSNIKNDVKYFVLHFTANPGDGSESYDGTKMALSRWNADEALKKQGYKPSKAGINYYINFDGQNANTYYTSETFTYHVPAVNGEAFGVEIAVCSQAKMHQPQIEKATYLAAYFLIENGYITEGQSSGEVVDAVIRGHGEFVGQGKDNDHTDWPKINMDHERQKIKQLLIDLGYPA